MSPKEVEKMQDKSTFEQFVFGIEPKIDKPKMEESTMGNDERKDKSKDFPKDRIQCVKCKGVFAQRPDVREKRIEKFGSAKKLDENYLCRDCRKDKQWNGKDWEAKPAKPEKKAKPKKKK